MLFVTLGVVILTQAQDTVGDWVWDVDCTKSVNVTECCDNGTSNMTMCDTLVGCTYDNSTGTCSPSNIPTTAPSTQAPATSAPPSSDSGMSTGAKIALFFFTYFLAMGVFYGTIKGARHFGYLKSGTMGEKMGDAKKRMLG
eukprot:TRINITY_DN4323_c1_g1_i1.p1 TRINITY_DN4323_c1_g1~~TRINITY_DN4323_c1_g1_i1.p1  ORF type:complete len:141 (+),score=23.48 TRINITY_DN4323_c1_g1_i1:210-632(+)